MSKPACERALDLARAGSGAYVGTVISSVNQLASWFGEGKDRWYVDRSVTPTLVGTGTEDYFNDGWNMRLAQDLRRGVTIMEAPHSQIGERISAYRWHVEDPVPLEARVVEAAGDEGFSEEPPPASLVEAGPPAGAARCLPPLPLPPDPTRAADHE